MDSPTAGRLTAVATAAAITYLVGPIIVRAGGEGPGRCGVGVRASAVLGWVKKGVAYSELAAGTGAQQLAATVSYDAMRTYRGVRCREQREIGWIWTSVVAEKDGRCWVDFEVGDRKRGYLLAVV